MQNPWDIRERQERGDNNSDDIFVKVGYALTLWEGLEAECAELFDVLVAGYPTNRAAHSSYISVMASSARTQLLEAAFLKAVHESDPIYSDIRKVIDSIGKTGARRNEIAHGRVYKLGEAGYFLGPNYTMKNRWAANGEAKYQYTAEDLDHYIEWFIRLSAACEILTETLRAREVSKTNSTSSKARGRDKRT